MRSLVRRGLKGVQLATSDAHEGLKKVLGQVLAGVTWQRCRVHFTLAHSVQAQVCETCWRMSRVGISPSWRLPCGQSLPSRTVRRGGAVGRSGASYTCTCG